MAADLAWCLRRVDALKGDRQPHESTWRDCFDHSMPLRGIGLSGDNSSGADGAASKQAALLHGVATDGCTTLASAFVGGTTPASARWFELDVPGADDDGKEWLDLEGKDLHTDIHSSNFDSVGFECALDMVIAGWFPLLADVDEEKGGFFFEQWPLSQCYIGASRLGGSIDTIAREYVMSAEQCVKEHREAKVSAATAKAALEKPDTPVQMVRLIYPRPSGQEGAKLARNLPFASVTYEATAKHCVHESGYHEFPLAVPRWALLPNSAYAVGRMFDALPDARELNELKRMEKQAAALNILPPFKATDDGVLNVGAIKRLQSGKLYAVAEMDNIAPIITGAQFDLAVSSEERLEAAIRRTLMADQLGAVDGPTKTATEIHARVALIRQLLGPAYGRLQAEYLSSLVVRCFMLKYRRGGMRPPPKSIAGQPFHVRFISPMARSQRLEDVSAMDRYEQSLVAAATSTGNMEVLDQYDWDGAERMRAELLGVPRSLIPDTKLIAKKRAERQRAQQAQQAQAMQQQAQQTMIDAAGKRYAGA